MILLFLFRELDRGTMYFRHCLNQTDLKDLVIDKDIIDENLVRKVLFKSIIYRLINKIETFMDFKGIPDEENFSQFLKLLKKKKDHGVVIFTAAHQNNGYDRLLVSLYYVQENIHELAANVVSAANRRCIKECTDTIKEIPNVANFFAWQIICDLLECKILGSNTDNQWTILGPGAKKGLKRIYCMETNTEAEELYLTRSLRDLCSLKGPKSGFEALGVEFPAILDKYLSLKNVEHALCEYEKYFCIASDYTSKGREYSQQKSRSHLDAKPRCNVCSKNVKEDFVKCLLCGSLYHKSCEPDWRQKCHQDGSWLCEICNEIEKAWSQEDFDYEEDDLNDNNAKRIVKTGEGKSKLARKSTKIKAKKAKKSIECIDLSSDEDDDEEEEENITDDDDDDEVESVEGVEKQKYSILQMSDFSDSSSHGDW